MWCMLFQQEEMDTLFQKFLFEGFNQDLGLFCTIVSKTAELALGDVV